MSFSSSISRCSVLHPLTRTTKNPISQSTSSGKADGTHWSREAPEPLPERLCVKLLGPSTNHSFQRHGGYLPWLALPNRSWIVPGGIIPHGRLLRETAAPGCS